MGQVRTTGKEISGKGRLNPLPQRKLLCQPAVWTTGIAAGTGCQDDTVDQSRGYWAKAGHTMRTVRECGGCGRHVISFGRDNATKKPPDEPAGFEDGQVPMEGHLADRKEPGQVLERDGFQFPNEVQHSFTAQGRVHTLSTTGRTGWCGMLFPDRTVCAVISRIATGQAFLPVRTVIHIPAARAWIS